MKQSIKIGLYGDSLSLCRPGLVSSDERYMKSIINYYRDLFPDNPLETIQRSKASITSSELATLIQHDNVYYNWPGEICILHYGIVDCAPRPVANATKEKIAKLPGILKKVFIKYLHNNRRRILLKGKTNYVTTQPVFKANTRSILNSANESYKKVFVINICPTNAETEFRSPGFSRSVEEYNFILSQEVEAVNSEKVVLIDIHSDIKSASSMDEYIVKEDGHHITPKTHQLIFKKISEYLP